MKTIQPVLLISGSLCHSPQLHLRVDQWEWWMTDVSTNHNYSWLIVPCQLVKELDQVLLHIHYHEIKRTSLIGQTVAQVMAGRAPLWKTERYSRQCSLFFFSYLRMVRNEQVSADGIHLYTVVHQHTRLFTVEIISFKHKFTSKVKRNMLN